MIRRLRRPLGGSERRLRRSRRRDPLSRVKLRSSPRDWADDELLTLSEAAALFFPSGYPLNVSSLRNAKRAGQLAIVKVAGKHLTTPRAVKVLVTPCPVAKPNRPVSILEMTREPGLSSIEDGKSAQAAAATKLKALRASSRPTSPRATNQQLASAIRLRSQSQT